MALLASISSGLQLLLLCIGANYHHHNVSAFVTTKQKSPKLSFSLYTTSRSSSSAIYSSTTRRNDSTKNKRIVLIRHGCTYMNEYLSIPGSRWGDANFTDVFTDPTELAMYRDSPLSPRGIRQAERLSSRLSLDGGEDSNIIGEIELFVMPLLVKFPIVDFSSEISTEQSETWWVSPPSDEEHSLDISSSSSSSSSEVEWRPNNEGQTYAEPAESETAFTTRMISLYDWLDARTERTIALICHWGVIEYLTGDDYDNCQMKVVDFNSMKRTGFMVTDEEFSEIFKEGERSVIRDVE
ncbi:hypothetical protein ACHAWC_007517 [Mediolabrus comicus]